MSLVPDYGTSSSDECSDGGEGWRGGNEDEVQPQKMFVIQ